jgi:GNAT superfamily N-acetyltransferase
VTAKKAPTASKKTGAPEVRRVGTYRVGLETTKLRDVKKVIGKGLTAHNIAAAGPYKDSEFIAVTRDAKGEVRGGFWIEVYYESAFLKWAWTDPKLQRKGVGRAMMAVAEEEAKRRGAVNLWLDTFSFQARPFYEKLGYTVYGTLKMGRPGVERYWMSKDL